MKRRTWLDRSIAWLFVSSIAGLVFSCTWPTSADQANFAGEISSGSRGCKSLIILRGHAAIADVYEIPVPELRGQVALPIVSAYVKSPYADGGWVLLPEKHPVDLTCTIDLRWVSIRDTCLFLWNCAGLEYQVILLLVGHKSAEPDLTAVEGMLQLGGIRYASIRKVLVCETPRSATAKICKYPGPGCPVPGVSPVES